MSINLATKRITGARTIVECMKREKVSQVFCVPGESYLPLLDALYVEPTIDVITTRHEGGASFMAEGYAKASLKPGVVMATRGVGATNLSIGVHTAYQDSTPMVVFLGQVHRDVRGREGFQEIDFETYFASFAKWAVEVKDVKRMPEFVGRAFRVAQSGRPGPVIVSLPEDVLPAEAYMSFGPTMKPPKPTPSEPEVNAVQNILSGSKKPLIIAGGGIKSAKAEDELIKLAEKSKFPVMAAFRRHDIFPNDHPLYAGHLGLGTAKKVLETVKEADVILAIGTRLSEVTTQDYSIITDDKKLVHLDIDDTVLGKVYAPDVGILADAREGIKKLLELEVNSTKWHQWAYSAHAAFRESSELMNHETDDINKQVIASLMERLPKDALLTNDAGNFAGWLHAFYSFNQKHTYVGPTSGAMGYGLPAALGSKLALPDKQVVALAGDGGFMMTAQEIETAVRHHIPVIVLVFNNHMYGTIRMHQEMHYPEKVMATDLGHIDFAKFAESLGASGYTVRTGEAFDQALGQALHKNEPTVIEIITEKEQISVTKTIEQIRNQS